jgi:hypothetical protein
VFDKYIGKYDAGENNTVVISILINMAGNEITAIRLKE